MASEREFTELIDQHRGILYKVIRLYVRHEEDERDLFQEILFQAWRSFPNFKGNSKFSTWLYRVALNTVLTFKRRPQVVIAHEDLSQLKTSTADKQRADEESEALYQAIRELNEIDRMIISLHLDGYLNEEIAEIAGLTKNNAAVKLHRIKENLINRLKSLS
ncbi:MAG: sigma-70 family RNA polymerase sigma factor [Cyclobacteriaceae bacterium]|nr:sigma-70 family RNA polymerase sigma factor [Cyclobacteriaceae bacterium]